MYKSVKRQVTVLWAALVLLLAVVVGVVVSAPAHAEQVCAPHEQAVAQLASEYKEQVIGRGLAGDGMAMVELFVSGAGTWTILVTNTSGVSCLIASGDSWATMPLLVGKLS